MTDGDGVQSVQAVSLRQVHVDELGVHILEVCEDEKLFQRGVDSHVTLFARVGVGDGGLFPGDFGWNEVGLDRACFLIPSNSGDLKLGLLRRSQTSLLQVYSQLVENLLKGIHLRTNLRSYAVAFTFEYIAQSLGFRRILCRA